MSPSDHPTPTHNQLWKWCLRADAVAQCYIRDVMELTESSKKDSEVFWWLGTVPCRNVEFVGMLVGAKAYEKRTMYTVDDGTGVIQCVHPHALPPKAKQKSKRKTAPGSDVLEGNPLSPESEFPKPRHEVGDILRVNGRVEAWHDTRQILVNEIQLCGAKDEPAHWISTAKLHKTYYWQPFVIPPLPPPSVPKTPVKPSSVASASTTPSTASTVVTPSTAALTTSAHDTVEDGPAKLRHPSRLHSKELISSTFKIYLKNYMDVLSDPSRSANFRTLPIDDYALSAVEGSPTKRIKRFHHDHAATPRPKEKHLCSWQESDATPRPSQLNTKEGRSQSDHTERPKGFTLSYLRRVPELADMANKVIEIERKRRLREARRMQKEAARTGKEVKKTKEPLAEPTSTKAKRLYTWALREMLKEGSIILHEDDAPVWELTPPAEGSREIWKTWKSDQSTMTADTTHLTTISNLTSASAVDGNRLLSDSGELSDPPIHEESYIPLQPTMLKEPIIDAIKGIMMRKPPLKPRVPPQASGAFRGSDFHARGPTAEELRQYMGNVDARWENVGEYTIADALELLKKEERVYRTGGRWELTI